MKKITIILALLLWVSCSNDDSDNNSKAGTDIKLVTGINIRSSEYSSPMKLGNPNVLTDNQFIIYPNPSLGLLSVKSTSEISDAWIIPAQAKKSYQQTDFASILTTNLYDESVIASNAEIEFNDLTATKLAINLSGISHGYYKVFVKINGVIYWDNFYFQDDNFNINSLINYWN